MEGRDGEGKVTHGALGGGAGKKAESRKLKWEGNGGSGSGKDDVALLFLWQQETITAEEKDPCRLFPSLPGASCRHRFNRFRGGGVGCLPGLGIIFSLGKDNP